jgi:hypothetical protein
MGEVKQFGGIRKDPMQMIEAFREMDFCMWDALVPLMRDPNGAFGRTLAAMGDTDRIQAFMSIGPVDPGIRRLRKAWREVMHFVLIEDAALTLLDSRRDVRDVVTMATDIVESGVHAGIVFPLSKDERATLKEALSTMETTWLRKVERHVMALAADRTEELGMSGAGRRELDREAVGMRMSFG